MFGFYRVSSAVPTTCVADVASNTAQIIQCIKEANNNSSALIVFPELCITGYTCGDLFNSTPLLKSATNALYQIASETKGLDIIISVGFPLLYKSSLYNCAAIIHKGKFLGIVPKTNLPNYREFYEKRWFTPQTDFFSDEVVNLFGEQIPFGVNIIFEFNDEFKLAFEICEDLWGVIPPSSFHVQAGATVIANLSASNELVGKSEYRRDLIRGQSAKCMCAYVYASAGVNESTSDVIYGGHTVTAENGTILTENKRFQKENYISYADIDCRRLLTARTSESSMGYSVNHIKSLIHDFNNYRVVNLSAINQITQLNRYIEPRPFVPSNPTQQDIRCSEIFNIQSSGLAKRLEHTHSKKSVIGISGGLDSTLALLVTKVAHELINKPPEDIIAITMPGFGTTDRTYHNAITMCEKIGCEIREINIKEVCEKQFELLGIDSSVKNTTYENVQARQRTMLLMNTANEEGGIVIGTGDLSEIALGWSTYNGDHMSMYAVNCGVPKTLIRYLIEWYANKSDSILKDTLIDIIDTPVSPELLPPDKQGEIAQKTEDIIGPYELHDFFLYHTVKYGASPEKIKALAEIAFKDVYTTETIEKYLKFFIWRFFSQQFKRNCIPDGPKVGTIALSPRGDWRMPPDASPATWLENL